MAKKKETPAEREYVISLRKEIAKVPRYKRTPKAIKAIKQFVAKHMRIEYRDVSKVKIDKWLNHEMWFRGIQNPLTRIKVKAKKDGEFVRVELAEIPEKIKYLVEREKKKKESSEKAKKSKKEEKPKEEIKPEETEEKKKEEKEKIEAGKEAAEQHAEMTAKEHKHAQVQKVKKTQPRRMALQK